MVYDDLRADGTNVRIVQHATRSLADDAAATRAVLGSIDGRVILVGHSYGSAMITEAGNHERVAALVYLHVTGDRMIPPVAQTTMAARRDATVVETSGSHAVYVSRPKVVADIIRTAAAASAG